MRAASSAICFREIPLPLLWTEEQVRDRTRAHEEAEMMAGGVQTLTGEHIQRGTHLTPNRVLDFPLLRSDLHSYKNQY